jgi:hypothetical protein
MYGVRVKRLQIYIERDSDEALEAEAAREGSSKAEIIRRLVAEHLGQHSERDLVDDLIGCFDGVPGSVDDVVYQR